VVFCCHFCLELSNFQFSSIFHFARRYYAMSECGQSIGRRARSKALNGLHFEQKCFSEARAGRSTGERRETRLVVFLALSTRCLKLAQRCEEKFCVVAPGARLFLKSQINSLVGLRSLVCAQEASFCQHFVTVPLLPCPVRMAYVGSIPLNNFSGDSLAPNKARHRSQYFSVVSALRSVKLNAL
jgi:hypothetical protein